MKILTSRLMIICLAVIYISGCAQVKPEISLDSCYNWGPKLISNSDSKAERNIKLQHNTYMQGVCYK